MEASSLEEEMIAAQEWGISSSDVIVNLLEEEKAFGILGKRLKVEARPACSLGC